MIFSQTKSIISRIKGYVINALLNKQKTRTVQKVGVQMLVYFHLISLSNFIVTKVIPLLKV